MANQLLLGLLNNWDLVFSEFLNASALLISSTMRPATICSIFFKRIPLVAPVKGGEALRLKPGAVLVRLKAQQPFLKARLAGH